MKALLVLWVALALTMATLQADGGELISGNLKRRLIDRKTSAGATRDGTVTITTSGTTNHPTSSTAIASGLSSTDTSNNNPSYGSYGEDPTPETDPGSQRVIVDVMPTPKPKVPRVNKP